MTARVHKADIDRALKAARESGLIVARVIIRQDEGEIIIETPEGIKDAARPDLIDW